MNGFEDTPLGKWADEQSEHKPEVEELTVDLNSVRINRRGQDGIVTVRISGASGASEFEVRIEDLAVRGGIDRGETKDIDEKADKKTEDIHKNILKKLIAEGKI